MENLSDGVKDGFVLFYLKDGKLNSVLLDQEQVNVLDVSLKIALGDKAVRVVPTNDIQRYL